MKQFLIGLACIGLAGTVAAQDPLSTARDLYASASYEEALVMLTGLREGSAAATVVEQVDQYRAFCLFALGRPPAPHPAPQPAPAPPVAAAPDKPEPQTPADSRPIYGISAPDVSAPVVVVQNVPVIPKSLLSFMQEGRTTMMLDLLIDER